jgi:NADPH:quinone reductase-like Zn-dependent oxidoreductase
MSKATSKYWQFDKAGGPEVLHLASEPQRQPGSGEVRVRVQALSLNRSDLMFLENAYVETPRFPSRFGSEVAGVVEAVGPGVENVMVGDRVTAMNAFAISRYGTFGESAILPARAVMKVPERFTPAEAASFAFAYMTNYFAFFEVSPVKPFQVVLLTAATSTTGLAAIPMLHTAGATVIATTRTNRKREALLKAGADHVIATEEEDLVAKVMELTKGHGADIAYDPAPGKLSERVANSIKVRGHWIVYGVLDTPGEFPWWTVFNRSLKFDMYKVSEYAGNPAVGIPGQEEKFLDGKRIVQAGMESGRWTPVPIDREFHGLEAVPDALLYMKSNQAAGKIVVTL